MLGLLIVIFFSLSSGFAQSELDSLIESAPGLETYPQASTVVLFERTRIELLSSGQTVRHREFLCKILDERATDPFGDQSVNFDADKDTVIIETARTRLADERWIEPIKQQNVSFPELEVGAAVHFAYRIEPKPSSKPPRKPHADGIVLLGGYEPALERQLRIEVSPPWKIRYDLQNAAPEPVVSKNGDRVVYDWTARDCPQVILEPNSVGLPDLVPRVLWTSFPDWEALGLHVAEPFWEKVDSSQAAVDGFLQITPPELQGMPALMNAAAWVLRNVRTAPLSLGDAGYEPHSADVVWRNRYGNALDKTVLLTALLRAYGFAPIPVLVPFSRAPFSNLPVLDQFNHVILTVPVGEDTTWLDPTADDYPPGVLPYACTFGKGCMLLAGTPLLLDVPAGSPESRGARTEMRLKLAADGTLSGTITCLPQGDLAAEARQMFKHLGTQEYDQYARNTLSRIGPGAVTSFSISDPGDLSKPVVVTLGFESPDYAERQEDTMLLSLPANPFEFAVSGFSATLPEVRCPVQLPPRWRVTTDVSLSLPDGYKVSYLPPPLVVQNPYVFIEISARQGPAGITWATTVEIKADKVPVADYPVLRDAYETLLLPKNNLVILEKK
ncbi:MAG: DUF3857 domain-containing protein [bacterium]|nr:DUF3857 domain-containing protein [bacterium]